MPRRQPLSGRQINVLRWIAGGCPAREWPDDSHKLTARALESRGLARVRRKGKLWHAILTEDGQYYLDHGRYPGPAQQEPRTPSCSDRARAGHRTGGNHDRQTCRPAGHYQPGTPIPQRRPRPHRPPGSAPVTAEGHPHALQDRRQPRADR